MRKTRKAETTIVEHFCDLCGNKIEWEVNPCAVCGKELCDDCRLTYNVKPPQRFSGGVVYGNMGRYTFNLCEECSKIEMTLGGFLTKYGASKNGVRIRKL